MAMTVRFITDLNDRMWRDPRPDKVDVFCPMLHGLPVSAAKYLALLPIHDANGLLIDALNRAENWPVHGWACIFAPDPFRNPKDLLNKIIEKGVRRIYSYPVCDIVGADMAEELNLFDLGRTAEERLFSESEELGLEWYRPAPVG